MSKKQHGEHLSLEAKLAIVMADRTEDFSLESRIRIEKRFGVCRHYQMQAKNHPRRWFTDLQQIVDLLLAMRDAQGGTE